MPNKALQEIDQKRGSRPNSQAIWIEVGTQAAGSVGAPFSGEPAVYEASNSRAHCSSSASS